MTIADQLTALINSKAALKTAIEAKGVTVGSALLSDYASKVNSISTGSGDSSWTRPSDWLAMPSYTDTDQKVVALVAVSPGYRYFAVTCRGAYTVNWGDGTIENFGDSVTAEHEYNYNTYDTSNTTLSSRGYKQAIITITPQAGNNLTTVNFQKIHSSVPALTYNSGMLDVIIVGQYLTYLSFGALTAASASRYVSFLLLEKAILGKNALTNFGYTFSRLSNLQSLPVFYNTYGTNFAGTFYGCTRLEQCPDITSTTSTSFSYTFYGCARLKTAPNIAGIGSFATCSNMFDSCGRLETVPLYNTSLVNDMSYMFRSCAALKTVPQFNTTSVYNMSNMFANCTNLEVCPDFTTPALTSVVGMFSFCLKLLKTPSLNTSLVTSFNSFLATSNVTEIPAYNCNNVTSSTGFVAAFDSKSLARLPATNIKYTFSVANCLLSAIAINELFTNLPTVTGQTVDITSNPGAATCTRSIATAKGWTVAG